MLQFTRKKRKKICDPALWLSGKSQPAAQTAEQTLEDSGSCFVHIKKAPGSISIERMLYFHKNGKQLPHFLRAASPNPPPPSFPH